MDLWIDETTDGEVLSDLWPDAPAGDTLAMVLEAAQEQCAAYAPRHQVAAVEAGGDVPARWKVGLVMHARAVYRSLIAGSGDQIGPDGITVTVWPMDRTVKAQFRPPRPGRVR
jgi:hypothetical protein